LNRIFAPLKQYGSPLFGNDIPINDQSLQNQRSIAICATFNGWLFSSYSYVVSNTTYLAFLKSTDDGVSWEVLFNDELGPEGIFIEKMSMTSLGNSLSNLKVALAMLIHSDVPFSTSIWVPIYDVSQSQFHIDILQEQSGSVRDFALAGDDIFPATNSNPSSMAIVYTKNDVSDSVVFRSSSNGGISFDTWRDVAYSPKYLGKIALAYGRCPSYPDGRYFASWEEKESENSPSGHILTAHSDPYFNSSFTRPVYLDSLVTTNINLVRNPKISCQFNSVDNDSTNLTEVILFEKYFQNGNRSEIRGAYNLQSTISDYFHNLLFNPSSNNQIQADLCFNPFDSSFSATYFDSTAKQLPILSNDFNMTLADHWNTVTTGYNDSSNIVTPYPSIKMDFGGHQNICVWTAERISGNGEALFDSQNHWYTGTRQTDSIDEAVFFQCYPNPCSTKMVVEFEAQSNERISVVLSDVAGETIKPITDQNYLQGMHKIIFDVSTIACGPFLCRFRSNKYSITKKIFVVR
jgi:hypothetical protein